MAGATAVEFELGGSEYRMEKLSAKAQFHVGRKVTPLVPRLVPLFAALAATGGVDLTASLGELSESLAPFAEGLAGMSELDADFVLDSCLGAVRRKQENGNWAPVWNRAAGRFMFEDMELDVMVPLVVKVLQDNLGNFINGLLSSSTSGPTKTA